jgi:predicted XRE-type DNA-binding protein
MAVAERSYSKEINELFAKCLHAYLECGETTQSVIADMVGIISSPDADEEERDMALRTFAEALFPSHDGGSLGMDLEEAEAACAEDTAEGGAARAELDGQEQRFAERLKSIMDTKQITQSRLAELADVGQPAISMMLSRHCRPQRRTVHKLAEALGVDPRELWPG